MIDHTPEVPDPILGRGCRSVAIAVVRRMAPNVTKQRLFRRNTAAVAMRIALIIAQTWSLLEGAKDGQSQYTMNSDDNLCVWNHPVDLHFTDIWIRSKGNCSAKQKK